MKLSYFLEDYSSRYQNPGKKKTHCFSDNTKMIIKPVTDNGLTFFCSFGRLIPIAIRSFFAIAFRTVLLFGKISFFLTSRNPIKSC